MEAESSSSQDSWDFRFKFCSAAAAVVSALSIIIGGVVGLYTYRTQTQTAEALKLKELRLMEYQQKRELYYQLVDAASAVANSSDPTEAKMNAQRYATLYYGKAHIFAIDPTVNNAKISFFKAMNSALVKGEFPSSDLRANSLALATVCKDVLRAQDVFDSSMQSPLPKNPATQR